MHRGARRDDSTRPEGRANEVLVHLYRLLEECTQAFTRPPQASLVELRHERRRSNRAEERNQRLEERLAGLELEKEARRRYEEDVVEPVF